MHQGVRVLVRPLARAGVLPNHVTMARAVSGVAGATVYATNIEGSVLWGSALIIFSVLLDRLDGELARATGLTSQLGHKLDIYSDAVVNAAIFIGLGIGLRDSVLGGWGPMLGLTAGFGVVAALAIVLWLERSFGARAGEVQTSGLIDPDDAMIVVPLAVLCGAQLPLVVIAAIAAPLCACALGWHFRAELRAIGSAARKSAAESASGVGIYDAGD